MLNPLIENAYKVLEGEALTREEALALADRIGGEDILDLVSLANKVRHKFAGPIFACSILNAKSGLCRQNCRFCAQAEAHHTGIETYPLLSKEDILSAAAVAAENRVTSFGIVPNRSRYASRNSIRR